MRRFERRLTSTGFLVAIRNRCASRPVVRMVIWRQSEDTWRFYNRRCFQ
jgi:hypothetical protein